MMENSPDPGETEEEEEEEEEEEDDEESVHCSPSDNPSLLEEIRQLSQASNNNRSYEGRAAIFVVVVVVVIVVFCFVFCQHVCILQMQMLRMNH